MLLVLNMFNSNGEIVSMLKRLGALLRAARLERNESQEILAQRLGVSRQTYGKMERGEASVPIGYWLAVSQILGRLDSWSEVLQEKQDLFARYDHEAAGRQRASGSRKKKT